jgi:magnesium transporter
MTRRTKLRPFKKRQAAKAGLPPGSIVYVGRERQGVPRISLISYDARTSDEEVIDAAGKCRGRLKENRINWLNIDGIHDVDVIKSIGEQFNLHPLLLEDIASTRQRPKTESYPEAFFTVVKMLRLDQEKGQIISEQVSFILCDHCLITFQEQQGDVFDPIRDRIREGKGRVRDGDAGYLLYVLLDAIVDSYFLVLEYMGDRVDALDDAMAAHPPPDALRLLHSMKNDIIHLRRCVWPLRDVANSMARDGVVNMAPETLVFMRDLYDHTVQIMDAVETYRDILAGLTDLYLSVASNRMNEVMKILTIIATIFIPLTFVAGIYGMNFEHMPELAWPWGYPAVLLLMSAMVGGMLVYFRRKGWL